MKHHVFDLVTFLCHSIEPVVGALLRGAVVGNSPSHLSCISVTFLQFHFTDPGVTSSAGIVAGVIAHSASVTSPTTSERVHFLRVVPFLIPGLLCAILTNLPHSSALLGLACLDPATLARTRPGDVSMALGSRVLKRG